MFVEEELTTWGKIKDFFEISWYRISDFFKNWIWPAYKVKRLFDRQDIVKLPRLKATEWCDVVERMYEANMELVKGFVEKEKPEEHVFWYKDDEGNDVGHKYGECEDHGWPVLFPDYKGKYVMDIIKEIYKWYTEDEKELENDRKYLLDVWYNYFSGRFYSVPIEGSEMYVMKIDESTIPTEMKFFDDKNLDWNILDKYVDGDRENILKKGFVNDKLHKLEDDMEKARQKYLHLCIEIRQYLWT